MDGTTAPDWIVQAELGEGADRFEGGNAGNSVRGAYSNSPQRTPRGTSSSAEMAQMGSTAASSGTPTPTSSTLGAGHDSLSYEGVTAGGLIDGGAGVDEFLPSALRTLATP